MPLKRKLFISVGALLLFIAILSYFLPKFLVQEDLEKTSQKLDALISQKEKEVFTAISSIIELRFNELKINLTTLSKFVPYVKGEDFFSLTTRILPYSPHIGFIQMKDPKGEVSSFAPMHLQSYPFKEIVTKEGTYVAICAPGEPFYKPIAALQENPQESYFLYALNTSQKEKLLSETDISFVCAPNASQKASSNLETRMEEALLQQKKRWIGSLAFLQAWTNKQNASLSQPDGYMQINRETGEGTLLLTKDLFKPITLQTSSGWLSQEKKTGNLVITNTFFEGKDTLEIGFLLSDILRTIAEISQKHILFFSGDTIRAGYMPNGQYFDPHAAGISLDTLKSLTGRITWEGASYDYLQFDIDSHWQVNAFLLIPSGESLPLIPLLEGLRDRIVKMLSFNLMGASLACFFIALIILSQIAKKVTQPIATLAKATEELEKGNYHEITLPHVGSQDEVGILSQGFEKLVTSLKEREKIRGILNKVVSKEIASQILKSSIELGGEERVVTMLFSDVRGFTKMTENIPPHVLINLMNAYLSQMCRIIDEEGGVVDKFVGDEIMALYGAPLPIEKHGVKAIESALRMVDSLKHHNQIRAQENLPPVEIGVGIHTGLVVAGNVGSENRLNYTVLGANVNLASRLCSTAQRMQVLVSEATLLSPGVQESFLYEELAPVTLKGISKPVKIFEIKGLNR